MQELIDRLEKAAGPDRRLDLAIWETQRPSHFSLAPHYTAHIDAALTLVPENHAWSLHSPEVDGAGDESRPEAIVWHYGQHPHVGDGCFAATPAIALCIAALKARQLMSS